MTSQPEPPNIFDNPWLARCTRWAMQRGVRRVVAELKVQGVTGANPFLGFNCNPVVWLVTRTDVDRDQFLHVGLPRALVIRRLKEAGVRDDLAERTGVTIESQQTVDRDFGGNWRIAMK